MIVVATNLTVKDARLVEQLLISCYTLDYLDNARREIAVNNLPAYYNYMNSIKSLYSGIAEDELLNLLER